MARCPSCAHENRDGAKFCEECAAPLAAPAPPREERKTVTVLFADLAGFTSRSESLDPEDVRSLVRPFHDLLRHESEAYGGTLARMGAPSCLDGARGEPNFLLGRLGHGFGIGRAGSVDPSPHQRVG